MALDRHRSFGPGGLIIALAIGLAACGGGSPSPSEGEAGASATPAESMQASAAESSGTGGLDLDAAAAGVSNLSSYQLDVSVESGEMSTTLTILASRTPTDAAHYTMVGPETLELIVIDGEGAWLNQGGTWTAAPGGADVFLSSFDAFAPDSLISTYRLGFVGPAVQAVGNEEKNGVATTHFHVDGANVGGPGDDFPDDGTLDIWVEYENGYLVSLAYGGTDPESGERTDMTIDVSRVNDPSIVIEAPI